MKSKTTAAIIAFFLGGFGIHRFYLGQTGKGILYLFFCWTFIPAIIAFIDMIVFLLMGTNEFNLKYNRSYIPAAPQQPTVIINNTNHVGAATIPMGATVQEAIQQKGKSPAVLEASVPAIDPFQKAGDEKYKTYDFDGAIRDYLKSLTVKSNNPEVHFKLGCLYSNLEQADNAFFHLSKAVEKGFYDLEKIRTADHLAFLRMQQPTYDNFVRNGFKLEQMTPPNSEIGLSNTIISQLERLAKMKDQGVIDDAEFKAQKSKLLNG